MDDELTVPAHTELLKLSQKTPLLLLYNFLQMPVLAVIAGNL